MKRKKYLIVLAGGSGSRMGSDLPKQFITLGGKAILRITIERFLEAFEDIKVITVLPQSHMGWWRDYCIQSDFSCPQTVVPGGITRFHSVANALARVPDGVVVAVHDAVRPFISVEGIRRLFSLAQSRPAVVPVIPCFDTLKPLRRVDAQPQGRGGAHPSEGLELMRGVSVDRGVLYAAQTPQIFHSELLKDAYSRPFDTRFTDDASVLESKNIPLAYVEGERFNIKITNQDDLVIAKALMSV